LSRPSQRHHALCDLQHRRVDDALKDADLGDDDVPVLPVEVVIKIG